MCYQDISSDRCYVRDGVVFVVASARRRIVRSRPFIENRGLLYFDPMAGILWVSSHGPLRQKCILFVSIMTCSIQEAPTSTSRTVIPPAILSVLKGMVGWLGDGVVVERLLEWTGHRNDVQARGGVKFWMSARAQGP